MCSSCSRIIPVMRTAEVRRVDPFSPSTVGCHSSVGTLGAAPSASLGLLAGQSQILTRTGVHHGTGTLLAPGWIITAAHCLQDDANNPVKGIAYVLYLDDGVRQLVVPEEASQVYIHPEYDPRNQPFEEQFYADVALIRVREMENLTMVTYPRLPTSRKQVNAAPVFIAAGVGLDETQELADRLEFVSVKVASAVGQTPDFAPWPIESDHFVTLDVRGEDQDTCSGDSGGGLLIPSAAWEGFTEDPELDELATEETQEEYDVLVGITSYGDGNFACGSDGTFGVYTDVLYWKDWIETTIKKQEEREKVEVAKAAGAGVAVGAS
jgi:secreted trypsin-like serine protease